MTYWILSRHSDLTMKSFSRFYFFLFLSSVLINLGNFSWKFIVNACWSLFFKKEIFQSFASLNSWVPILTCVSIMTSFPMNPNTLEWFKLYNTWMENITFRIRYEPKQLHECISMQLDPTWNWVSMWINHWMSYGRRSRYTTFKNRFSSSSTFWTVLFYILLETSIFQGYLPASMLHLRMTENFFLVTRSIYKLLKKPTIVAQIGTRFY